MTKALWENIGILPLYMHKEKYYLDTALSVAIPLHPGAELYYKEIGLVNNA